MQLWGKCTGLTVTIDWLDTEFPGNPVCKGRKEKSDEIDIKMKVQATIGNVLYSIWQRNSIYYIYIFFKGKKLQNLKTNNLIKYSKLNKQEWLFKNIN